MLIRMFEIITTKNHKNSGSLKRKENKMVFETKKTLIHFLIQQKVNMKVLDLQTMLYVHLRWINLTL